MSWVIRMQRLPRIRALSRRRFAVAVEKAGPGTTGKHRLSPLSRIGIYRHAEESVQPWFRESEFNPWPSLGLLLGINVYVFWKWNEYGAPLNNTEPEDFESPKDYYDYTKWLNMYDAHIDNMMQHFTSSVTNIKEGRWYTLVTAEFSHQAPGHIFSNMAALLLFGFKPLRVMGPLPFLGLYLGGGIFCSVTHVVQNAVLGLTTPSPSNTEIRDLNRMVRELPYRNFDDLAPEIRRKLQAMDIGAMGASGSIMAVAACGSCLFPKDKLLVPRAGLYLPLPLAMVLYAASDVISLILMPNSQVDHVGHIAGLAFGFGYAALLWRVRPAGPGPRRPLPLVEWIVGLRRWRSSSGRT